MMPAASVPTFAKGAKVGHPPARHPVYTVATFGGEEMRLTEFAWVLVALLCTIIIFLWEIRNQLRSIATSVSHLQDVSEYSETIDENVDAIFHRVKLISESKLLK